MKTWSGLAAAGDLGVARALGDRTSIIAEGESATSAWFLASGAAEIFHVSESGFSVVVKLVTAPTVLASPEVLVAEPVYRASIRAAGEVTVHAISRPVFLAILQRSDANLEAMIDIALAFTGAARMEAARLQGTDALLANLLLGYDEVFGAGDDAGRVIALKRSQAQLADAIGAAERSVNRVITRWKGEGVLSKNKGLYTLHDVNRLRAIAGDLAGGLVHRWREVT